MTYRQLQTRARAEWQASGALQQRYPTFVYYWQERYVRVYGLDGRGMYERLWANLRRVAFP